MSNPALGRQSRIVATILYRPANDDAPARNPFWQPQPLGDTLADVLAAIAVMVFLIAAAFWLAVIA